MDLVDVWPVFGLSLRSPRLQLRVARDEDLPGLLEAAQAGIHDPSVMPFGVPWTDAEPEEFRRSFLQHQWRMRTRVRPDEWALNLAVFEGDRAVGFQDISVNDFALRGTVESGSWLTRSAQGRGLGKEMRAAVLLFAFDHLGAQVAETSAAAWNAASLGVSRGLGYVDNGSTRRVGRPGETLVEQRMRLDVADFRRPDWTLRVEGLEAARKDLIGDGG